MQAVQPEHNGCAPVGDCPYLVALVYQYLGHGALATFRRVVLDFRSLRGILPDAVVHGGHPKRAVLVEREVAHHGMDVHGQALELRAGYVQGEDSLLRSHIHLLLARQEGGDILVDAELGYLAMKNLSAVVAAEAIIGSQPDESKGILHDVAYSIGCQPVVHRNVAITIVGSCRRGQERQQRDEQKQDATLHVTKIIKNDETSRMCCFFFVLCHYFALTRNL